MATTTPSPAPSSMDDVVDGYKDSGEKIGDKAKDTALDGAKSEGEKLGNSALDDIKDGKVPDVEKLGEGAVAAGKKVAEDTLDAATKELQEQSGVKPARDDPDAPQSFDEMPDSLKESGVAVAEAAKDEALKGAKEEGEKLADSAIEDIKNGKMPDVAALADKAVESLKKIAQSTGTAGIDAAKEQAQKQVDNALGIISNEFPILGGILGLLSKPIIEMALNEVAMPEF
jgi:hypothetical protein